MLPELVLYFREGCHLCEDMEQLLGELLEPGSFRLTRIDIDEDPTLREAYNVRVPVLSLVQEQSAGALSDYPPDNQLELCEHFLDLEAVREALASYNRQLLAACSSPAEQVTSPRIRPHAAKHT